ncbi:C4-dicarboxylate ABC transporter substrate-binding protein [Kushneria pakistanensis]|uniref:C4-dicarboxylate ABC transporter substrate-binding protein n=1 Tax=Kushneria pakistanensis TaxID=1508770 RepID=A0ABQ3FIU2_9GAMM|nr:TAXI family TRAP transporter solute-binding subunit [Kushneria pakistanensis]GHC24955.1 C4-dicarboxylate ABC transporter substrate-binding protein [Kushneria pakistanensis]
MIKRQTLASMLSATAMTLGAMALSTTSAQAGQQQFMTIGTGGQTGVYYVVGQSVCRFVNQGDSGYRCNAPSTGASVANVNGIENGDLDIGVAQSDVQYNAYHGEGQFEGKAHEDLRSVFAMHGEPLTLVARADSGIRTLDDLKGKRVNIGNPGSGNRATMEVVMAAKGWTTKDFSLTSELDSAEQASALADNNIDAMVFVAGHPNGSIQEATTTVDARIIPLDGEVIQKLVEEHPYYSFYTVPGGMYKGNPDDVKTFGVGATLVSAEKVNPDLVYAAVKSVFDNFDRFKKLHPAFATLDPETMVNQGLSAPLHEGAKRYYQEKGWLNE